VLPAVDVSCSLVLRAQGPAAVALQVVGVGAVGVLRVLQDGEPVRWTELATDAGGTTQRFDVVAGEVVVHYAAHREVCEEQDLVVAELDRLVALRPSRYCPSDRLGPLAGQLLGTVPEQPWERAVAVADWVRARLAYVSGSSTGSDGALETLLSGQGVCRDFAHLVVALCRAVDVPARVVAVYAPGLTPMDFHAVAEVAVDGCWRVLDATGLAPRTSLVRIATGRDAADTAFLTTIGAPVALADYVVLATTVGDLPVEEGTRRVSLP
jgi:transglutaminase-like putative cysteine protease